MQILGHVISWLQYLIQKSLIFGQPLFIIFGFFIAHYIYYKYIVHDVEHEEGDRSLL